MLTVGKIKIFRKHKGYYDGYYMQTKTTNKIISDDEWCILDGLIQDLFLVRRGLASKEFEKNVIIKLHKYCDSQETIDLIKELEKYLNEP